MRTLLPAAVVYVGFLTGCTSCPYRAGDLALSPDVCPERPAEQRAKVYAVIFKGFDPFGLAGTDKLRDELNRQGFAKVYCVEFHHEAFMEKEVAAIRCDEPDARFVVIGCGLGAGPALSLTTRLARGGVPVDALVEVSPVYLPLTATGQDVSRVGRHVVIAGADSWLPGPRQSAETLTLTGAGHFSALTHPATVQSLRAILLESAELVPPAAEPPPTLPLVDDPAPVPGGTVVVPTTGT